MTKKIAKFLAILLAVPLFCGVAFAATTCDSESACESQLKSAESIAKSLAENVKDLEEQLGRAADDEEHEFIFTELEEAIEKVQTHEKETVAPLKIKVQSFKMVDSRGILTTGEQIQFGNLSEFIGGVIDILVKMVAVIAFALLVVGGFRLVAAAGNDNEIQKAKTMITYSIIGLAVVLLAYLIVLLAQTILYR